MQRAPQLSSRERSVLLIYLLSALGVAVVYFVLGLVRDGLPAQAAPAGQAEIAVLVPLRGEQADLGQAVLIAVQRAVANPPEGLRPGNVRVSVRAYDTRNTPDGAASAALNAAQNPATAAIIGPLNAREVYAAADVLRAENLALISPASTAPGIPNQQSRNLYRLPALDAFQGEAIVEYLLAAGLRSKVYLIASPQAVSLEQPRDFKDTAGGRFIVVGESNPTNAELGGDLAGTLVEPIQNSRAQTVVFLGEQAAADRLREGLSAAGVDLPFISQRSGRPAAEQVVSDPSHYGVYLIAEPSSYTRNLVGVFNQAAQNRLNVVGTLNLGQEQLPADLADRIFASRARAVVYLGGIDTARTVLQGMNQAGMDIPFIGSDLLDDPSLAPLPGESVPVFITSSWLRLAGYDAGEDDPIGLYMGSLAEQAAQPYAYESTQATWLVLDSLLNSFAIRNPRQAVQQTLASSQVVGMGGEFYSLRGGTRTPIEIYVYRATSDVQNWLRNPLVYVYRRR